MAFLETKRDRAAFLIFVLGLALIWTLWPFSTGLIGAPVLYVVFAPVYRWLARRMPDGLAAGIGSFGSVRTTWVPRSRFWDHGWCRSSEPARSD